MIIVPSYDCHMCLIVNLRNITPKSRHALMFYDDGILISRFVSMYLYHTNNMLCDLRFKLQSTQGTKQKYVLQFPK